MFLDDSHDKSCRGGGFHISNDKIAWRDKGQWKKVISLGVVCSILEP